MKFKLTLIIVILLSMLVSVYIGYKITYILFSNYAKSLAISADELKDYEDLWLSVSILCDLLTEYDKRMKEKGDVFTTKERNWIIQDVQPTLQKIKQQLFEKQGQKKQNSEKKDLLFQKFQYLCERINTMFQFPDDQALKKAVYTDFFQYLQFLNEHIEQKNLQRLIPLSRILVKFQKLL